MEKVTVAGWGLGYDYNADKQLSSCMTNQAGDLDHRFEFCDLEELVGNMTHFSILV